MQGKERMDEPLNKSNKPTSRQVVVTYGNKKPATSENITPQSASLVGNPVEINNAPPSLLYPTSPAKPVEAKPEIPAAPPPCQENRAPTGMAKIGLGLVIIGLLGGLAYYVDKRFTLLEQHDKWLVAQQKRLRTQVDAFTQSFALQQKRIDQLKAELPNTAFIALSQANFLAELANQKLDQQEVTTAIELLQAADRQLIGWENRFIQIREALKKDILQLSQITTPDKTALWQQIETIKTAIEGLTFQSEMVTAPLEMTWSQTLSYSWQTLKSVAQRTLDNEPAPFSQKALRLQALYLMCDHIQWTILQGKDNLYQSGLQSLQQKIQQTTQANSSQQQLLAEIHLLQQQAIESKVNISASLQALSQALVMTQNSSLYHNQTIDELN